MTGAKERMRRHGRRTRLIFLTATLLVAAALRLWRLNDAPPGLSGDEIFNAIDAAQIGLTRWPVYFPGNNGREPLFFYLAAATLRLVGSNALALRLPAAFCGLLSISVAYRLGVQLRSRETGLLAAALLAVSFWPLLHARWGLRAVTLTLGSGVTFWLYWRAARTGRWSHWIAAGAALGLTFYTYIPARVFPAVIFLWLVLRLVEQPADRRAALLRRALASMVTAAAVMAPLLIYMVRFPAAVNQRIGGLYSTLDAARAGDVTTVLHALGDGVAYLAWRGDADWRYNIVGKPAFEWPVALFLAAGAVIALLRAWRGPRRAGYLALLAWFAALYSPNLLVPGDLSALRPAGAVLPAMLCVGLALDAGWARLRPAGRPVAVALLATAFLVLGLRSARDYFQVWNSAPETRAIYAADLPLLSDYLAANPPPPGTRLLAGYGYVRDITLAEQWRFAGGPSMGWFERQGGLAWPAADPAWIFVPADGVLPAPAELLLVNPQPIAYPDGTVAWTRYELGPVRDPDPRIQDALAFAGGPQLLGYDLPTSAFQGDEIAIQLYWRIPDDQQPVPNALTNVGVRLKDVGGNVRGATTALLAYPQSSWRAGDLFVQQLQLLVPAGMLPGPAILNVQLFDADGQNDAVRDLLPGDPAPLLIQSRSLTDFIPGPGDVVYGDELTLTGAALSTILAPGLDIDLTLSWVALRAPTRDFQVRLDVIEPGQDMPLLSQTYDLWPGVFPPTAWGPGERVTTLHQLEVPLDLEVAGDPWLRVAIVDPETGVALPVVQGTPDVAALTVERREHRFEAPPPAVPVDVTVGTAFRLLGYELDRTTVAPGGMLALTLIWQAEARPDGNYTVFNQLVGGDGQIWGQFDGPPVGDAWRTETWLPGEVVVEQRLVPLRGDAPAGSYRLLVGLYDPATLIRLPVTANGAAQPDDALFLTDIEVVPALRLSP